MLLGLGASQEIEQAAGGVEVKCPHCGFTQADFKKAGRLGCPECYKTFAEGLEGLLKTMHKGTRHVGKVPEALRQNRDLSDRLKTLQKKLDKAIEDENFEQAALLRDEIKQIGRSRNKRNGTLNAMDLHEFLHLAAETARRKGPHDRIVMSSRVRLARNIKDARVPRLGQETGARPGARADSPAVESLPEMKEAFSESMDNLARSTNRFWWSATSSAASTPPKVPAAAWS